MKRLATGLLVFAASCARCGACAEALPRPVAPSPSAPVVVAAPAPAPVSATVELSATQGDVEVRHGGVWQPVPLALGGPGRGEPWVLTAAEEPELRELVELIASARHGGRVAWSLARFEMGCERSTDPEALSDNLLAIRSLLEADDDTGRASLAQRLAALCSEEPQRAAARARLEAGFALERRLMAGVSVDPDLDEGDEATPRAMCGEIEHHVRALLRDVVCGYLDPDLRSVADDILLAGAEPIDIQAHDTRAEEPEAEPYPEGELDPEGEPESERDHPAVNATPRAPDGPGTAADPRSAAWAVAACGRRQMMPVSGSTSVPASSSLLRIRS